MTPAFPPPVWPSRWPTRPLAVPMHLRQTPLDRTRARAELLRRVGCGPVSTRPALPPARPC